MQFVNLNTHPIRVHRNGQQVAEFAPSGIVARVSQEPAQVVGEIGGIPVGARGAYGEVEGLPAEQEGVGYIVSGIVGDAIKGSGRKDIFVPATGPKDGVIRGNDGQIAAVAMLIPIS